MRVRRREQAVLVKTPCSRSDRCGLSLSIMEQRIGSKQAGRTVPNQDTIEPNRRSMRSGSHGYLEDLPRSVRLPVEGSSPPPQPSDGSALSGSNSLVGVGIFEEESTPVVPATSGLRHSQNDVTQRAPLASLASFGKPVKGAARAIDSSDLL